MHTYKYPFPLSLPFQGYSKYKEYSLVNTYKTFIIRTFFKPSIWKYVLLKNVCSTKPFLRSFIRKLHRWIFLKVENIEM